jgi:hypothetical protein
VRFRELAAKGVIDEWSEGIDKFHLLERLGAALELIESDSAKREERLTNWNSRLDATDSAIDAIEGELVLAHEDLPAAKQEQLFEHLICIDNNKDRMRYASLIAAGVPVGSGTTESAAKTVIGQRAKNSGQRWSQPGLPRIFGVFEVATPSVDHAQRKTARTCAQSIG